MNSIIGALCVLLGMTATAESQTTNQDRTNVNAAPRGSISGRVTLNAQGANELVVMLTTASQGSNPKLVTSTKTDAEGRFHLAGVAAGRYVISGFAPAYTDDSNSPLQVTLSDGQDLEGVDINLVLGGVITGRLLDPDGQPVEGQEVQAVKAEENAPVNWRAWRRTVFSDDRGVYRIYGLLPGRYVVRAGINIENTSGMSARKFLPLTFHPGVTDRSKAAVVAVESGSEVTGIDIAFGQPKILFEARGRVEEADTGRPVAGARIGYGAIRQDGGSGWSFVGLTDGKGYFKIPGLGPGHFYVSAEVEGANSFCRPAEFEIKDGDISDLKLRLQRGATISGIIQVGDGVGPDTLSKLRIWAIGNASYVDRMGHAGSSRMVSVSPEGAFEVIGLPAGETRILLSLPKDLPGLVISRIEHPMVQVAVREGREPEGVVSLQPGEQISGVRIIVKRLTGGIRGVIKLPGGTVPIGADLSMTIWRPSGAAGSYSGTSVEIDANGKFEIKGLPAGQYKLSADLILQAAQPGRPRSIMRGEKIVTVGDSIEEIELGIEVTKQ